MNAMAFRSRKGRNAKAAPVTLLAWDKGAEEPANKVRLDAVQALPQQRQAARREEEP